MMEEKKRMTFDLLTIFILTAAALALCLGFQDSVYGYIRDVSKPILLRTLLAAICQFGIAGFGITVVALIKKESFRSHGLQIKGLLPSVALCALCFVPYTVFALITKQTSDYLPFGSVWVMKDALSSGFPVNVLSILLITAAWGFFEGFNYVFISDKINKRFPSKNRWLNWGAIVGAVTCLLIHGMVGVSLEGMIEMLTIAFIIYGMLIVRDYTGNAWGCVFIFIFLWNAF